MAENVGSIEYDARISTDKLKHDANEVDRLAKNAGQSIGDHAEHGSNRASEALHKFGKVAAVALAAAGAAAVAFGVSAAKAFIESENAIAQTEAVLKSTKQVAGVTSKAITDLANSFQRQTRYSDETIRSAENMLLTFTNISSKTFPGATEAVLDMATAMGTDLQSTAIQVGKALQDPVLGATALQRVGVRLTQSQKDLIEKLVKTGDAAGAQAVILKELQTEFGGSAKAAGETFAGRLDILKNQLGEVQEGIGEIIIRGITPLVSGFLSWFDAAGGVEGIMNNVKGILSTVQPILVQWAANVANVAKQIGEYLGPKLQALWNSINQEVIPALMALWKNVIEPLIPVVGTMLVGAIGLVIDALNLFIKGVAWTVQAIKDGNPFIIGLTGLFGTLAAAMAFNAVFNALNVGFATLRLVTIPSTMASIGALQALIATPIVMPAIAVAAALAAIALVYNAYKDLQREINAAQAALKDFGDSRSEFIASLGKIKREGKIDQAEYDRRLSLYNKNIGANATGTNYWKGGATWVGEHGPEIVNLPRGSQVIPNHEAENMGGIVNNIGTINVASEVDADSLIRRLTQDHEIIGNGLVPQQRYA